MKPEATVRPWIVDLHDPLALNADLAGTKAANLAHAAAAGLPVLPGFAITTEATDAGRLAPEARTAARRAWRDLAAARVVVRSSSTVEDAGSSSMAGQFTSVLGVVDLDGFDAAVDRVLSSAADPAGSAGGRPMAILVQPELDPIGGGVLFGIDPVTGDRRTCAVDVVRGSPERVVNGTTVATHVVLGRGGGVRSLHGPPLDDLLTASRRRALARLARRAARAFGSPQDIEWAVDRNDRLWLLQSRPITAAAVPVRGPVYGPGPLAETFPAPLRPLEVELWIDPLREGITAALSVVGAVPERRVRASRVVTTIGGWPAVDLDLIGAAPTRRTGLRRLDPMPAVRRMVAAWRTGRLRGALPLLTADLLEAVDRELLEIPPLDELDDQALIRLLEAAATDLRALYGYEVLCGMLLPPPGQTAAGLALRALQRWRGAPISEEELLAREPVVLALVAPSIGNRPHLPLVRDEGSGSSRIDLTELAPREALRLRCRWVQELGARAAEELGHRLSCAGRLADPARLAELSTSQVAAALDGLEPPLPPVPFAPGPPLPSVFRMDPAEVPIVAAGHGRDGLAASAGRASGRVRHVGTPATAGVKDVLVVDALVPQLAGELDHVAAIVSETGSPLSHLAILAREHAVPVTVGVEDARRRFPEGVHVIVDGNAGTVTVMEGAAP